MTITKIKRIGATNRFHVYADEKWAGVFLDEILARYEFKTGAEIDDATFKKIKAENDERVAFDMAVYYLEKYVVSEKGLKDYLKKKGFAEGTIQKTISKLHEYEMVDDEKFAKNFFESVSQTQGKRTIARKLIQKGVSKEIVDNLLENVSEDDEFDKAKVLAEKFVKNREKNAKNKQKCLAHLVYKGYDYSVARKVTDQVFANMDDTMEEAEDDWF